MKNTKKSTVYEETIKISAEEYEMWERYLKEKNLDYSKLNFGKFETLASWYAEFPDGCEVNIRINSNAPEDGDIYSEGGLTDGSGCEIELTDCCDCLGKDWIFHREDEDVDAYYRVKVIPSKEK